ncbi:MAG: acetate/propionate family kinase [Betaproteobacteria bacterium]|nr:acetate/propionate family kinase [Betaproteobacteria bacterium]
MSPSILVFNSGSSSVKFALFSQSATGALERTLHGQIENIEVLPEFSSRLSSGKAFSQTLAARGSTDATREGAFEFLLSWLRGEMAGAKLVAAGHRVVHGAARYSEPIIVDRNILATLETFVPLAPLHQGHNLAGIRTLFELEPSLPQIACFDTAFHATQHRIATLFALPRELTELGLRRYGFHGLSYEYIASVLPEYLGASADGRIIVAHLGNGASLCAMSGRRSIATSMGFTALEGLVMGTRPGALDPGILLYLMRERGMDLNAVTDLLYHRCGLLGVSGISHDMRTLLSSDDPRAAEAVDLFVHRAIVHIGGLVAVLGGLDALVFTAGIGEHAPPVRKRICEALAWLGLDIDEDANSRHGPRITAASGRCSAWVIPTNEELMIARHALQLVGGDRS